MDLGQRCVIAVLKSGLPGTFKKNKNKTQQVCAEAGASDKAGRWSDCIWPEEAVKGCQQQYARVRELLYSKSSCWVSEGQRIMLAGELFSLRPELDREIRRFEELADESAGNMNGWIEQARTDRNGLFNPKDYPKDQDAFRRKFKLVLTMLPVPSADHIVCALADDDVRVLREGVDAQVLSALEDGRQEVLGRITEPLRRMVERLSDPEAIFRDSLIENVREIAKLVPALNISGDTILAGLGAECGELARVDPESLRHNKARRASVAEQAAAILAKAQAAQ